MVQNPQPKKNRPSPRRDGREAAVQFLFGCDVQSEIRTEPEDLEEFWKLRQARPLAREFAVEILKGVFDQLAEVDIAIRNSLENYAFHRVNTVDRAILRVGAYEILFASYIPQQAALNEAIEIAKRFGSPESPRFINGVLDRVMKNHPSSRD